MCLSFNSCVLFEIKSWGGIIKTRNRLLWEPPSATAITVSSVRTGGSGREPWQRRSLYDGMTPRCSPGETPSPCAPLQSKANARQSWDLFPQFATGSELPLPIQICLLQASPAHKAHTSKLPAAPLALQGLSHAVQVQCAPCSTDHESQDKSYTEVSGELRCAQLTTRWFSVRMLQCHYRKADNSQTAAPLCILMILLEWP